MYTDYQLTAPIAPGQGHLSSTLPSWFLINRFFHSICIVARLSI